MPGTRSRRGTSTAFPDVQPRSCRTTTPSSLVDSRSSVSLIRRMLRRVWGSRGRRPAQFCATEAEPASGRIATSRVVAVILRELAITVGRF